MSGKLTCKIMEQIARWMDDMQECKICYDVIYGHQPIENMCSCHSMYN
jgi:hypothetical protein